VIAGPSYWGLDLGRKRDLTSLVGVERIAPRRPEAADHLRVCGMLVWDPKRSPTGEVDFAEVRAALGALPVRCAKLAALVVDEGAEAGTVLPYLRAHPVLSALVQGFIGTPKSNLALWSALKGRFYGRTLSIPNHPRLLGELRGLQVEQFAFWRVTDRSKRFHRDVSVSLAMAVWAAGEKDPLAAADLGADAGQPPAPARTGALFPRLAPLAKDADRGAPVDVNDLPDELRHQVGGRFHQRRRTGMWR
jgi:hypothetical protein